MICIFVILLAGWCRTRMRPARLVSYAFLYTTDGPGKSFVEIMYCLQASQACCDGRTVESAFEQIRIRTIFQLHRLIETCIENFP